MNKYHLSHFECFTLYSPNNNFAYIFFILSLQNIQSKNNIKHMIYYNRLNINQNNKSEIEDFTILKGMVNLVYKICKPHKGTINFNLKNLQTDMTINVIGTTSITYNK